MSILLVALPQVVGPDDRRPHLAILFPIYITT
jgi:hypothetical protein